MMKCVAQAFLFLQHTKKHFSSSPISAGMCVTHLPQVFPREECYTYSNVLVFCGTKCACIEANHGPAVCLQ